MKCYTFESGKVAQGIELVETRYGLGLILGAEEDPGRYEIVLSGQNGRAPRIQDGKVIEAFPLRKKHDRLFLVAADSQDDRRILLRVNTRGIRARRRGAWGTVRGTPQTLLGGWGCHPKDDPETSSWDDGLVVLNPSDVLEVRQQGYEPFAVALEESGQVVCLPLRKYEQQKAAATAVLATAATAS